VKQKSYKGRWSGPSAVGADINNGARKIKIFLMSYIIQDGPEIRLVNFKSGDREPIFNNGGVVNVKNQVFFM